MADGSLAAAILKFTTQLGQHRLGSVAEDDDAADERGGRRLSMTSATVLSVSVETFSPTPAPSPLPSLAPSALPTVEPMPAPTVTAQPSISRAPTAAPTAQARKRDGRWRFLSLRPTTFAILAALFALALLICCIWCSYAAHGQLARDEAPKDGEKEAATAAAANSSAPPDDENRSAPPDDDARELGAYDAEEPSWTGTHPTERSLEILGVHPNANADLTLIVPQVVEKKADSMFLFCEGGLCGADESAMAEVWRH